MSGDALNALRALRAEEGTDRILAKASTPQSFALLRPASPCHACEPRDGSWWNLQQWDLGTEALRGDLSTKNPQQQPWLFALMQTGCIRRRCGCFALRLHPTIHSYRHAHIRPRSGTEEWGPVRSHLRRGLAFGRHGALRECRAGLRALL